MAVAQDTHRFCTAPMMRWSTSHARYLVRLLTKKTRVYTPMIPAGAVAYGDWRRFLDYNECEHPIALQLGGSRPEEIAVAAKRADELYYDEVNLNMGCPSPRVQKGVFGAALMKHCDMAARCVEALRCSTSSLVSVKCRLGVDDQDIEETLPRFVRAVVEAGAEVIIVHVRKAWLQGLSPSENRTIPPLEPAWILRLRSLFPGVAFVLNGGLRTPQEAFEAYKRFEPCGVMMGRGAFENPSMLMCVDSLFFDKNEGCSADAQTSLDHDECLRVVRHFLAYAQVKIAQGVPMRPVLAPLLPFFNGRPYARRWRRLLSQPSLTFADIEQELGKMDTD